MDAKSYAARTCANWSAWVDRACGRGRDNAARCGRFLAALPDTHPSLKDASPDLRARWTARLNAAAKGA